VKRIFYKSVVNWVPLGVAIVFTFGAVYLALQQSYRTNANDPQVQIAQDLVNNIAAGEDASSLNQSPKIDIGKSLSTFVIVYNKDKQIIANTATLGKNTPAPPKEVLNEIGKKKNYLGQSQDPYENRFTWQPQKGVRLAVVIAKGENSYVLVGRNLREVENRIANLTITLGLIMVLTLITSLGISFALGLLASRKPGRPKPKLASKKAESTV
jgi:hypothetical protein